MSLLPPVVIWLYECCNNSAVQVQDHTLDTSVTASWADLVWNRLFAVCMFFIMYKKNLTQVVILMWTFMKFVLKNWSNTGQMLVFFLFHKISCYMTTCQIQYTSTFLKVSNYISLIVSGFCYLYMYLATLLILVILPTVSYALCVSVAHLVTRCRLLW